MRAPNPAYSVRIRVEISNTPGNWKPLPSPCSLSCVVMDPLSVLAPPIPRTVRFAEASASGSSVLTGRKNKGAVAYREFADALLKHWKSGKALATFTPEL